MEIHNIIENVTAFVTYFAPGYIFLYCFYYSSATRKEDDNTHLFIKSISLSFLIITGVTVLLNSLDVPATIIRLVALLAAIALGFLCGIIHRFNFVNEITLFLFARKMNNDFWLDLFYEASIKKAVVLVRVAIKDTEQIVEGQIHQLFHLQNDPMMVIAYYSSGRDASEPINEARLAVFLSEIKLLEYKIVSIHEKGEL